VDLDHLPEGLRIGTSSPRRAMQLARRAPHIRTEPIRGNLPTRLEKVARGDVDGTILAAAGLERLFGWPDGRIADGTKEGAAVQTPAGFESLFSTPLPIPDFPPAPGQGALALQTRADDPALDLAAAIDHAPTRAAITAERAFLRASGGGCQAALGALATVQDGRLTLRGHLFRDGGVFAGQVHGPPDQADRLGAGLMDGLTEARP
jgi:hydroxymethylbilane synthase